MNGTNQMLGGILAVVLLAPYMEGRAVAFTAGTARPKDTNGNSLQVTIAPSGAVGAGAQWQVDGGTNQVNGATVTNLSVGDHTVSFTPISGWATPSNQIVAITNGEAATASGLYFFTNTFIPTGGIYNGLFITTNGVTEETAGMLRLTVEASGVYSGILLINGASHVISGNFDLTGHAINYISRSARAGGPLTVLLTLNGNEPPQQVTGTVSGTNNGIPWMANLIADFATNTLPSAQYTLLFPPDTNNAPPTSSPGGDGYALITNYAGTAGNPAAATARISGALADGTAFSQTVPVSQDGYVPLYANLYGNKGLLLGWINLQSINTNGVSLTWIHPERVSGLYKQGFTNVLYTNQILLSPWTNSSGNIDLMTNLSLLDTINDPNSTMEFTLTISDAFNLGEVSDAKLLSGAIYPRRGLFNVVLGRGETRLTGFGAILFNTTNGGGYFLTKTNAQALRLEP